MTQSFFHKLGVGLALVVGLWLGSRYLLSIALPFLLAGLLAVTAEPLVRVFNIRLKLPRGFASGIGIVVALLVAALVVLTVCAFVVRQLGQLVWVLPDLEGTALQGLQSLEGFLLDLAAGTPDAVSPILTRSVEGFFSDGTALVDQATAKALQLASGVVTRIPDSFFGFGTWILASFMISAKLPRIRQWIRDHLPESWHKRYRPAIRRLRGNLSGWLSAQLKLTGVTFLTLCVGFLLLRIQYAPLWAALICLVDALPILGTGSVLIPWSLVCFLQDDPVRAVGLLAIYATGSVLRSILEPRLVGRQLGLDPLVTLFAIYAGYRLWGILGMLFSPLLAVTISQLAAVPKEGQ